MNFVTPSVRGSGTYRLEADTERWHWSVELYELHELPPTVTPTTALLADHMHPEDRDAALGLLMSVLHRGGTFSSTYRLRTVTGRELTVLFLGESFTDDASGAAVGAGRSAGRVAGVAGLVLDITEPLANAASEAVEASARNRAAIEQVKGALMVTYGLDPESAFDVLRRFSNHHNIRLAALAGALARRMASVRAMGQSPEHSLLALLAEVTESDEHFAAGAALGHDLHDRRDLDASR